MKKSLYHRTKEVAGNKWTIRSIVSAIVIGIGVWQGVVPTIGWIIDRHTEYVQLLDRVCTLEKTQKWMIGIIYKTNGDNHDRAPAKDGACS